MSDNLPVVTPPSAADSQADQVVSFPKTLVELGRLEGASVNLHIQELGERNAQAQEAVAQAQFAVPAREETKRTVVAALVALACLGAAVARLDGADLAMVLTFIGTAFLGVKAIDTFKRPGGG